MKFRANVDASVMVERREQKGWRAAVVVVLAVLAMLATAAPPAAAQLPDGGNSIETVDARRDSGGESSMVLDADGNPVIVYEVLSGDTGLRVVRCNDSNCAGGDESSVSVTPDGENGRNPSLALDAVGNPVIAYTNFDGPQEDRGVRIIHCNDPNCAGGDESNESIAGSSLVGTPSLVLDAAGFPVIVHRSKQDGAFELTHCNDTNCAGDDEHNETFVQRGTIAKLQLDAAGFPVVLSFNQDTGDLWMLRCNDPNCADGDDPHEPFFGRPFANTFRGISLALDANEHPVVAVSHTFSTLTLIVCNDTNCAGGDENVVDLEPGVLGQHPSLALNAAGVPVIAYLSAFRESDTAAPHENLHVLTCHDALCETGGHTLVIGEGEGSTGGATLVLDADGLPVVSYAKTRSNRSRVLMHCGTTDCGGESLEFCEGLAATIVATGPSTHGTDGRDIIVGRDGVDRIYAGAGNDLICAGPGDDRVYGGDGNDRIFGEDGFDRVYGGVGNDRIFGGDGPDKLLGQRGNDELEGGDGDDRLVGGRGDDYLDGGAGVNTLIQ